MQKMCRTCTHWRTTAPWQGQCDLHPWPQTRWSETARVPGCPDYTDRFQDYRWQKAAGIHATHDPRTGRTAVGPDPDATYDRLREERLLRGAQHD